MKNENNKSDFLEGIEIQPVDWNSIDTSKVPEDCDKTPVDYEFECYQTDIPDDIGAILDVVQATEDEIRRKCKLLNEGVFNSMKAKIRNLVKLDDAVVFEKVIDSTIRYKNSHHFNDLYSLYRKLGGDDIRKFCYTEIHSMYCRQVQQLMLGVRKAKSDAARAERNSKIFKLIDDGIRYKEIAAKFNMSEISIKKLAQKHKARKQS